MSDIIGEGKGTSHDWKYRAGGKAPGDSPIYVCRCGDAWTHDESNTPDAFEYLQKLVTVRRVRDICPFTVQAST